jgi:hypothetical protein
MPCDLEVNPQEIRDHIHELQQGRFILRTNCASADEAQELVAFVREHSRVA